MTIDELKPYGLANYQLTTASMESDSLTLSFARLPGMEEPPLELGQEIEIGTFYGRVWNLNRDFPAGSPVTLEVEVGGLISVLDKIPCVLLHGLKEQRAEASGAEPPKLVSIADVVDACNRAATQAGLEVEYIGGGHPIMMPWAGGTDSIWSVLQNALRWVPCARTVCTGRKLTIFGLQDSAETPVDASSIQFTQKTRRAVSRAFDELPPPVVAARGGQNFEFPAGASIYQPGAFVYQVPEENDRELGADKDIAPGYSTPGGREAQHQVNGQWMKVRGKAIPPGMIAAADWSKAAGTTPIGSPGKWAEFWQSFGAAGKVLGALNAGDYAFGAASFDAVPGQVAYPADEADASPAGGKLGPMLSETANVPANYEAFAVGGSDNIYVLTEGSFPASTSQRGNVRGLHFCRGTITQYCWLLRKPQNADELDFFNGTGTIKEAPGSTDEPKLTHFTCLQLSAVFINRRSKRYQTGTNKNAPDDPDFDAAQDTLGDATEKEQEEWKPDYHAALKAYYDASRALGTPEEEITLFEVSGYIPFQTTLQEAFFAAELGGNTGRMTYSSADRMLTVSNSRREVLGVDDFLQRQELGRRQRQNEEQNRAYNVSPAGIPGENWEPEEPEESEKAAMVSPSISMTHSTSKPATPSVAPWTVFPIGDTWYCNGGTFMLGSRKITIGITSTQYRKGIPGGGGWNANSDPHGKIYRDESNKLTFDLYDKNAQS